MNKFLSEMLGFFNAIAAVLIISGCTVAGFTGFIGAVSSSPIFNAFVGLLLGCIFAVLLCGFIAVQVVIKDELSRLNHLLEKPYNRLENMPEK